MKGRMSRDDREILREAIAYLETHSVTEYAPTAPCPPVLESALGLLPPDYDYLSHHEKMENAGVQPENMSREQLCTMFTFCLRGERFSDGFIAGAANDGTLLRLFRRLEELTAPKKRDRDKA